ncbi:MAG TPA: YbaL family putative K(+) efflux transporter, partial [Azospirillaceae bacterium]|nr:YbaL family putative K(+) efflux transporter [Azospirillaceae bacterium]
MHHGPLIAILVAGFGLAFVFGALAYRLRVSPLVGYLLAGVAVGPFTPGFVADQGLANELAEIGVILLMFGVGLHFSLKDLLSVRTVAVPGAVVQIAVATLLGAGLATWLGWPLVSGLVFGLALSVASTVVLLRALQERRLVQTERGRIAVGWLIVEDLAMVLALVVIPAIAGPMQGHGADTGPFGLGLAGTLLITLGKVSAFVAVMLIVGRRVIPWVLHWVAHTGSRELFRLSVLAIALSVAFGAAALFGVSFALGAFFAGMILSESALSQQAAAETLPLRDAFAVLFFVSVGMLFNPAIVVEAPWELAATLAIILFGKSVAAFLIVRAFGRSTGTALTISASLAQIGEFSFILAGLGVGLGILPAVGRDLILAGAILSILLNPMLFALISRFTRVQEETDAEPSPGIARTKAREGHTILIGYGRVGALVGAGLKEAGRPFIVVEDGAEPAD